MDNPHRARTGGAFIRRIFLTIAGIGLAVITGCGSGDPVVNTGENTQSNLVVMRRLVGELGRIVLDSSGHRIRDTVVLDVDSSASSWIARAELGALLGSTNRRVLTGSRGTPPGTKWNVRGLTLTAEYRDIRKPGIFAKTVVNRVITASFTSEITDAETVVFTGTNRRSMTDTVAESGIGDLETESMEFTRGDVPDLHSLDRFIEPFVIIGATGAAILLFFQVRS